MRRLELTGKRFGRLTVLEDVGNDKHGNSIWKCICDCENQTIKIISSNNLERGHTKSCGCLYSEKLLERSKGEVGFNKLLSIYKLSAKKRNLEFNLTRELFKELTQQNCQYCGFEPKQIINNGRTKESKEHNKYIYNGIDRINNNMGYIIENCVPCCKICNNAKTNMKIEEFYKWINRLISMQQLPTDSVIS